MIDAAPKATQQINFTENLEEDRDTQMFFIIEEAKETALDLSRGTVKAFFFDNNDTHILQTNN